MFTCVSPLIQGACLYIYLKKTFTLKHVSTLKANVTQSSTLRLICELRLIRKYLSHCTCIFRNRVNIFDQLFPLGRKKVHPPVRLFFHPSRFL